MSSGTAVPRSYARSPEDRPRRADVAPQVRRSNAAIPVVIVLLGVGVYFGPATFLIPALIGLVFLGSGASFLSTRVNPLSSKFYLTTKPSWLAVGVVFLGALLLLADAYVLFQRQVGTLAGHL
jgi:hypothetical protein